MLLSYLLTQLLPEEFELEEDPLEFAEGDPAEEAAAEECAGDEGAGDEAPAASKDCVDLSDGGADGELGELLDGAEPADDYAEASESLLSRSKNVVKNVC